MEPRPDSKKRFVLGAVVPFVLVVIALPVAPQFLPDSIRNTSGAEGRALTPSPAAGRQNTEESSIALRENRRVALDVVDRWESEYRRKGGRTQISDDDLQHLRRALL